MIAPAAKAADWFRSFLAWHAAYRQVSPDAGNGAGTVPGNSGGLSIGEVRRKQRRPFPAAPVPDARTAARIGVEPGLRRHELVFGPPCRAVTCRDERLERVEGSEPPRHRRVERTAAGKGAEPDDVAVDQPDPRHPRVALAVALCVQRDVACFADVDRPRPPPVTDGDPPGGPAGDATRAESTTLMSPRQAAISADVLRSWAKVYVVPALFTRYPRPLLAGRLPLCTRNRLTSLNLQLS